MKYIHYPRNAVDSITIANDGSRLIGTNYWSSPMAACGLFYLSFHDGRARMLVPPSQHGLLAHFTRSVRHVILSLGVYVEVGRPGVEWLVEDGSDTPFVLHLDQAMCGRLPTIPPWVSYQPAKAELWLESGGRPVLYHQAPALIRQVGILPCLQPLPAQAVGLLPAFQPATTGELPPFFPFGQMPADPSLN